MSRSLKAPQATHASWKAITTSRQCAPRACQRSTLTDTSEVDPGSSRVRSDVADVPAGGSTTLSRLAPDHSEDELKALRRFLQPITTQHAARMAYEAAVKEIKRGDNE